MSKRLILVLCVLISLGACAAFDTDNTPYEGFAPDEVPMIPGGAIGIYSGYYAGTMTVESNACAGVADAVGDEIAFTLDVIHDANTLNITFEDDTVASGDLVDTQAIFMDETAGTKHVYYLDFAVEDSIDGSCEVIEVSGDGSYGEPCASYVISMQGAEPPAEEDLIAEEEGSDEESDEESAEGEDGSEEDSSDEEFPLEIPVEK